MLTVGNLSVSYGAIAAVRGVDIEIAAGEIVALIGANGAGKTTIAKAIAGIVPFHGNIHFDKRKLKPNAAEQNLRAGIALVPEGRGILARMTVEDNLLMGLYCRADKSHALSEMASLLERFPVLGHRRHTLASLLSGGEQQILTISRALLAKPRLLLLDEPSLGLAPKLTNTVLDMVTQLRNEGLTVLLIEQRVRQALKIADRAYLLDMGRVVTSGKASDLIRNSVVSETFLGHQPRRQLLD